MEDCIMETKNETIKEKFYIKQGKINYKVVMILKPNDILSLNLSKMNKFMQSYEIKLNLEQIKEKHISFSKFNSLQEFLNLVKDNISKKGIIIYKKDEDIIRFEFKKNLYSLS